MRRTLLASFFALLMVLASTASAQTQTTRQSESSAESVQNQSALSKRIRALEQKTNTLVTKDKLERELKMSEGRNNQQLLRTETRIGQKIDEGDKLLAESLEADVAKIRDPLNVLIGRFRYSVVFQLLFAIAVMGGFALLYRRINKMGRRITGVEVQHQNMQTMFERAMAEIKALADKFSPHANGANGTAQKVNLFGVAKVGAEDIPRPARNLYEEPVGDVDEFTTGELDEEEINRLVERVKRREAPQPVVVRDPLGTKEENDTVVRSRKAVDVILNEAAKAVKEKTQVKAEPVTVPAPPQPPPLTVVQNGKDKGTVVRKLEVRTDRTDKAA